jgi:single-stranded DNA-specific DHH superfamily exonuclease
MAKNKTTETESSVIDFINNTVEDETKRNDAFELIKIMQQQTGFEAKMWGPGIIGFGSYHYKYASGHEGDAPLAGFSPRKAAISLYVYLSEENREQLLSKFGKHKAAKGCIYIKKLSDIDVEILKEMVSASVAYLLKLYPSK